MEKNKENALNQFLGQQPKTEPKVDHSKTVLDERVDKVLVTKDGKQLLREQY